MLNDDFRFIPILLPTDLSWRDGFWAMSRTRRARSRELERLKPEWKPELPLIAVGEFEDARRAAAVSGRDEAVGEVLYGLCTESLDSVDDAEEFFWWPFGVFERGPEVVLMEWAKGLGWLAAGVVYVISKARRVVPPCLSPRSDTYRTK